MVGVAVGVDGYDCDTLSVFSLLSSELAGFSFTKF